jgi:NhaP-type Na+/H+ or K+/H+ antiporter
LLAWGGAEYLGGNGFLAAFVAGLTVGNTTRELCHSLVSFIEAEGQLLVLFTFMAFGAVMVWPALDHIDPMSVAYAVLSLTVIRMIPVAVSLWGLKLLPWSYVFLGWFGPRGVASILFGLMALGSEYLEHREPIFHIVMLTVFFSVIAHGVTAYPFAKWYSGYINRIKGDEHEEAKSTDEMPVRISFHGPNHF